ncbi:MAG: glycosyltransferase family 4 protein [Phycisphaeraceae bacterium]
MDDAQSSASTIRPRVAKVCAIDFSVLKLLRPQIEAMQQAGYDVVSFCSDGPSRPQLEAEGLAIEPVEIARRIAPWQDLKALVRLTRLFRRGRFDIVHTHTPKAALLGQLAAWLARVPVRVNTVHGLYYLAFDEGLRRRLFKALEIFACRLATYVFSQSEEDLDLMQRERLVDPERLAWLGNGIDLTRFRPGPERREDRRQVREELGLPEDAFVVGIVARMVPEKGFRELFEAFARLRGKADNAYLLHVGIVDHSRSAEVSPESAEQFGVAEFCRFAGQRDDVDRLMAAMDVFCLPSYREGYPRSVMEANAMGLPAVATDIRGCREAVQEEVNGLLVPAKEVEPLAAALWRLYENADLRQQLSEGARRRAEQVFDEQRVIDKILAAYRRLLASQAPKQAAKSSAT